ncbi:MAG: class I SAM-dependent methyltransferase [Tepidisphaeraceae bacterium]|jgi:SAM-dependent methyltransferase
MIWQDSRVVERFLERGPLDLDIATLRLKRKMRWEALLPRRVDRDVASVTMQSLLDRVHDQLLDLDETTAAMTNLVSGLWAVKSATNEEDWDRCIEQSRAHPIRKLLHEDPFCARSFRQPRGYPGDAPLIDYLYTRDCRLEPSVEVTPLGERIFEFMVETPAGTAVRKRRDLAAATVDSSCAIQDQPAILSVACGHLREAARSAAVVNSGFGRYIGMDQDDLSLDIVRQEVGGYGVHAVQGTLRSLFRGPLSREKFDLVYTTGLYDYLDDRIASKLTERMFEMLNPGGRLLIANFMPGVWICAYMEAFMDWKLLYRTPEQMIDLTVVIPANQVRDMHTFIEENSNIVFLDMTKA